MRRHAKASSAGSTLGQANGLGAGRRALATRGAISGSNGSGAPSHRRRLPFAFLGALVLAITICLGAAAAIADAPPTLVVNQPTEVGFTTAKVTGTINPNGGPSTNYWNFEYSSNPSDPGSWNYAFGGEISGVEAEGSNPVTVGEDGELQGLRAGTEYSVRLADNNENFSSHFESQPPYPSFTTEAVDLPAATIDPVTTFTATSAHFTGTVDPEAPGSMTPAEEAAYKVNWHFQCTPQCPGAEDSHSIPEDDVTPLDSVAHVVSADATGLQPNIDYEVSLIAGNAGAPVTAGPQGFTTDPVAPTVETLPAFALGNGTEALVGGNVNAKNSATTYWVEYGTTEDYGHSAPVSEDGDAGSAGEAKIFTEKIDGLTPGTTYHFRLVAENAVDKVEGKDMSFESTPPAPAETCSNGQLRSENSSTELPECRAYEQVSPVDKNGYDAGSSKQYSPYVAAEDGSALAFESYGAFADPAGASTFNSYLNRRGDSGWTTQALTPPQSPAPSVEFPEFMYFTPDMKYAVVKATRGSLLAPGATPGAENVYLRNNNTGTYQTLSLGGAASSYGIVGVSAGAKHVVFQAGGPLTPDAPAGVRNIYDWSNGQLHLVAIQPGPDQTPMPSGGMGAEVTSWLTHAVSEDGSRVVFRSNEDGQLYLRENGQSTVPVSTTVAGGVGAVATFWGASADTSKIFFTENTDGNLYRYDVSTQAVTNLTASAPGSVMYGVPAISDDGSYVYFRAWGQLVEGEGKVEGEGNTGPERAKLYLWHNGTISLVAIQSDEAIAATYANATTYRVTADGRYLTFATPSRLTAYDNTDAVTGQPDSEVYRYDAFSKELTCVSCNPDGKPPHGDSDFPGPPSRPLRNLQPGVSEDGSRVFFNSSDALVPNDVNGKGDVYEWKDGRPHLISSGSNGDPSYYASASKSGDDVFFATREQLVATDKDQELDVYDAHVGGGFPRPVQPPSPCEGAEACHGPASAAPGFAAPASGSLSTTPPPSPRVQRLKAALRACKHKPKKKAKAKCRKTARKRFTKAGRAH